MTYGRKLQKKDINDPAKSIEKRAGHHLALCPVTLNQFKRRCGTNRNGASTSFVFYIYIGLAE